MSGQLGKVVSLILLERFGPVIEKVGTHLFKYGTSPLLYIKKYTELPLSKIKEALCILIKYRLVKFEPNQNENVANYTLCSDKIILMLRYPKYNILIKKKFGDEAEMIIEQILQRGYWTASELILKVVDLFKKSNIEKSFSQMKEKFTSLVVAKYIARMPAPMDDKPVPVFETSERLMYVPPEIDIKLLVAAQKENTVHNFPDKDIYWTVNFDRFHQDMRDKFIVSAFSRKFDDNAGEIVRLFLQQMYIRTEPWADVSNPVPLLEIKDIIRKQGSNPQLVAFFDQYINILEQDGSQIIRKAGEASGGSFSIYMKEAFTLFAWETLEQMILDKFDSKAARIFRLVKSKGYIESDQIQQQAMIPAKEAKRLSYQLLEENYLQIQDVKKAASNNGPVKSFTLFHINLESSIRMVLELAYKTLYNVMTRRTHEKETNKRIIDKKQRVDTIIMGMSEKGADEEQLADIAEMITPPEKEILERIDATLKKLNTVELEIDETIFLIQLYLTYK